MDKGSPSFIAGGIASLVVAVAAIVDRFTVRLVGPDAVLAASLLLLALSTGSIGLSLRKSV